MPTPLEILRDPLSLTLLALYASLLAWERIAPARVLPEVKGWRTRALLSFVTYFYLSSYLPLLWDGLLAPYHLFDLTGLGTVGGALVALLAYELAVYVWHRSMHRSDLLFRTVHQMHHSAERLDALGAFYFSPLGMVAWSALGSLVLVLLIGVTPEAATVFLLVLTFLGVFQHTNVSTPPWLGYLVQRPESHSVHHERGVHAHNYADLPVFDLLFGTFRNPVGFAETSGYYDGASARIGDMLLFRDVTTPPAPAKGRVRTRTRPHRTGVRSPASSLR